MYIYKITVLPLNQSYFGLDTKPSYKLTRWKAHCRAVVNNNSATKLHSAMRTYGIENCTIEIVADNFNTIAELAMAEIAHIKKYNTYQAGLNSTPGGDGMGKHDLSSLTKDDILQIKASLGERFQQYNNNTKWAETTSEQRKELTKHLHTAEINQKKSTALKSFYTCNPDVAKSKGSTIVNWQLQNRDQMRKTNAANGKLGAEKVSQQIKVVFPDGSVLYYSSQSAFFRETGEYAAYIIKKTAEGKTHNGYQAWRI
jgi:hypothetical protein